MDTAPSIGRTHTCACRTRFTQSNRGHVRCGDCSKVREWAQSLKHHGARRLKYLHRWAARIADSGRRSWENACACGNTPDGNHAYCHDCRRIRQWAHNLRRAGQSAGRGLQAIERWAARIARSGRRSWENACACGNSCSSGPRCEDCRRVRKWARSARDNSHRLQTTAERSAQRVADSGHRSRQKVCACGNSCSSGSYCDDCLRMRSWAHRLRRIGESADQGLQQIERWAERVVESERRSWEKACACGTPCHGDRGYCKDCLRVRKWAGKMRNHGGHLRTALERWAEDVAGSGLRSWQKTCACGKPCDERRNQRTIHCNDCVRVRNWARSMTQDLARRRRSLEIWAEGVARSGRRSWLCACGNELPNPHRCTYCRECAQLRYWARHRPVLARLEARRRFGRESGDWNCMACGSLQGPVDHVSCTVCGCDVTTGEPDAADTFAIPRDARPVTDPLGQVVWNGSSGAALTAEHRIDSHIAWMLQVRSEYRVRRELW